MMMSKTPDVEQEQAQRSPFPAFYSGRPLSLELKYNVDQENTDS
jgi:hypothetical protein